VNGRVLEVEVRRSGSGYSVTVDGRRLDVDVVGTGGRFFSLVIDGRSHEVGLEPFEGGHRVHLRGGAVAVELASPGRHGGPGSSRPAGPARLLAPMPGRVVRVLARKGSPVEAGQGLVVIEAMKMENELKAPRKGCVDQIAVHEGQAVEAGALLLVVT